MKKEKEKKKVYLGRLPTAKGKQVHKNKKRSKKSDRSGRKAKHKKAAN